MNKMNFRKLFHHTSSKPQPSNSGATTTSQKLFYRPGTIEELEEDQEIYEEPKYRFDNEYPSLHRNCRNTLLSPSAPNLQRIHTSSSLGRLSAAPSLARVSTANSSLYQVAGTIRQESLR